eukprot:1158034-Pelagomonas_calceolata.AAC.2
MAVPDTCASSGPVASCICLAKGSCGRAASYAHLWLLANGACSRAACPSYFCINYCLLYLLVKFNDQDSLLLVLTCGRATPLSCLYKHSLLPPVLTCGLQQTEAVGTAPFLCLLLLSCPLCWLVAYNKRRLWRSSMEAVPLMPTPYCSALCAHCGLQLTEAAAEQLASFACPYFASCAHLWLTANGGCGGAAGHRQRPPGGACSAPADGAKRAAGRQQCGEQRAQEGGWRVGLG